MTSPDLPSPLSVHGGRVRLSLSVVPNARRTGADGLHDGALRLRLAAPPIEGRANDALVAWLAKSLGIPRREIELLRGDTGRRKQVELGVTPERAADWLRGLLAGDAD
ncbi:MAG TPA: DUF167 domain-containing protein [Burkholderiaceae bacterium]